MKLFYLVLNWIFGILFLLVGLITIVESFLVAICFIAISVFLIPPVKNFIESKINKELTIKIKVISIFILFVISGVFTNQSQDKKEQELLVKQKQEKIDYFNSNRVAIISSAKNLFSKKNYKEVVLLSDKYMVLDNKELKKIGSEARKELATIDRRERTKKLLTDLKNINDTEYEKNQIIYQQLVNLHPDNKQYKSKLEFYKNKMEKEKERLKVVAERKRKIESQFSPWDGSHRNLERVIKKAMNDPDSYEHAETVYWDKGDYLVVRTTYRGKNAFGGVVKNFVKAKVSLDGQILQILDET